MSPASWAKIAGGVVLVIAFLWYRHSLIAEGEARVKAADAKAVAAAIVHNKEVETRAKTLVDEAAAKFKATVAAPPADSPHVRLRQPATCNNGAASSNAGAGSVDHATAGVSKEVAGVDQEGIDRLTDKADELTRDADAQITALQAYVTSCQAAGICGR